MQTDVFYFYSIKLSITIKYLFVVYLKESILLPI